MELAGLSIEEYYRPVGLGILLLVVWGLISTFIIYGALSNIATLAAAKSTMDTLDIVNFIVVVVIALFVGYLMAPKARQLTVGAIAGGLAMFIGALISGIINLAILSTSSGYMAIAAVYGSGFLITVFAISLVVAIVVGAILGIIGQVLGHYRHH